MVPKINTLSQKNLNFDFALVNNQFFGLETNQIKVIRQSVFMKFTRRFGWRKLNKENN